MAYNSNAKDMTQNLTSAESKTMLSAIISLLKEIRMAPMDSCHPEEFLSKGNQVNRQTSYASCTSTCHRI